MIVSSIRRSWFATTWSFFRGRNMVGSTIVHVFDLGSRVAHTAVTPAKGGFLSLTGLIEVKSGA